MEYGTNTPIARAAVKTKRVFSALQTNDSGLFVFDKLEPGPVHLELSHPAYEAGSCDTAIPVEGGDAVVHCFLRPQRTEGAISGQLKDEQGLPLAGAHIEIAGPVTALATSDRDGLFAVPDAPEGSYRLRVEADAFFVQVVELEVRSRETATPQIVLLKAPSVRQVRREGDELTLTQPISFEAERAELAPSGEGLLREIADVLFRNRDITLLEIQDHADERGARDSSATLSQARADAVRSWLVAHGVDAARLQARGYAQDKRLGARAGRVQFVVKQTAADAPNSSAP
jgi:outer membrane protein OmpA-like peptidoglycan-associated protein